MIGACRDLTDYRRASEWIEATERYCDRQSLSGFPGVCRVHRAEVAAVGGAWERAEQELERATTELGRLQRHAAAGRRLLRDRRHPAPQGRLRGRRGRPPRGPRPRPLAAAGARPRPTRRGQGQGRGHRDRRGGRRGDLGPLGPGASPAGPGRDRDRGRRPRLERGPRSTSSPAIVVGLSVAGARGRPSGRPRAACCSPRATPPAPPASCAPRSSGWREVGAPYEVARARAVLSRALRALEDDDDADLELQAALDEFRRLGARVDVERAERELRDAEDRRSGPPSARKTFMFTDIVGSTKLAEALGDEAWERLLRWHDDTLRSLVARGGGEIVNSTGDGFFVGLRVGPARRSTARSSIQRALRDHRASTGFALSVRIGLHTAEANRRGDDYSGKGVHVAARVAALAEGGEILATAETLDRGRRRRDDRRPGGAGQGRDRAGEPRARSPGPERPMFQRLDYVYLPSRDVAADVEYFTAVLGARLIFAIDAMGTRVAMVKASSTSRRRCCCRGTSRVTGRSSSTASQTSAPPLARPRARGWRPGHGMEIPQGPIHSFTAPGGQRLAIYQLTRPGAIQTFAGRRDF